MLLRSRAAIRIHLSLSTCIKECQKFFFVLAWKLWEQQNTLDPEKQIHTPELYVIWNEKVNFLAEAIKDNPFDSDYFLWTDIGSFRNSHRNKNLTTYPDTETTSQALGTDRVFFLQIRDFMAEEKLISNKTGLPMHNFQYDIRLGGAVLGGHRLAVRRYERVYYRTMKLMQDDGRFIGKDQNIMSSVAVMYPNMVHLVKAQTYLTGGDAWFYSLYYFSRKS